MKMIVIKLPVEDHEVANLVGYALRDMLEENDFEVASIEVEEAA